MLIVVLCCRGGGGGMGNGRWWWVESNSRSSVCHAWWWIDLISISLQTVKKRRHHFLSFLLLRVHSPAAFWRIKHGKRTTMKSSSGQCDKYAILKGEKEVVLLSSFPSLWPCGGWSRRKERYAKCFRILWKLFISWKDEESLLQSSRWKRSHHGPCFLPSLVVLWASECE